MERKIVGIALFNGVEILDFSGPFEVFSIDDLKLKSSMTLFASAAEDLCSVFVLVLEKYFRGEQDGAMLRLVERLKING